MPILQMHVHSRADDPSRYSINEVADMEWLGYIYVQPIEISFPDPDPRVQLPKHIAVLEDKKKELLAKCQSELTKLDETIQTLLCLEAPASGMETSDPSGSYL